MRKLILPVLSVIALAGCHGHGATLTLTPSALKDCGSDTMPSTIEVHWDATLAKPKHGVKIWINNDKTPVRTGVFGGDPGKLWTGGGLTGSSTTGKWMYPGTTIIVTGASSDDVLASMKVPSAPCQ